MSYLQLHPQSLPATATPETIFGFLRIVSEGGFDVARLALLVSEENALAGAVLARAGFQRDGVTTLPGGFGLDGNWRFHWCTDSGPFVPLTSDPGAPAALRLATYVDWTLGAPQAAVDRPATLDVATASALEEVFNTALSDLYEQLRPVFDGNHPPAGWLLQFAASNNSTDDPKVEFRVPFRAAGGNLPPVTFDLRLVSRPNGGTFDPGATLQILGTDLVGSEDDVLLLDGGRIITRSTGSFRSAFEYDPDGALTFPVGGVGRASCAFDWTGLYIRCDDTSVGVYLVPDATGEPVEIRVAVRFALIMAQTTEGLAYLMSLVNTHSVAEPELSYALRIYVGGDWDAEQPLITWSGRGWKINPVWTGKLLEHSNDPQDEFSHWDIHAQPHGPSWLFSGLDFPLRGLLGDMLDLGGEPQPARIQFGLLPHLFAPDGRLRITAQNHLRFPMGLSIEIAGQPVVVELEITLDLVTFRLGSNKLNFKFPPQANGDGFQIVDLQIFALLLPNSDDGSSPGGVLDFQKREFNLTGGSTGVPALLVFPGHLKAGSLANRLVFQLRPFDPDTWPNVGPEQTLLRLNGAGLSLSAAVNSAHVMEVFEGNALMKPISVAPMAERNENPGTESNVTSQIVLIGNAIRAATIFAEMDVPCTDDLIAHVELGLRQSQAGRPPEVYACVSLERPSGKPIAQLSAGYLQLTINPDGVKNWMLSWDMGSGKWKLALPTDGCLALASKTADAGGIDDLRKDGAIKFTQLDLMKLHAGAGSIEIPLADPVRFTCLDGQFAVTFHHVSFAWGSQFVLACESAEFRFTQPSEFDVSIRTGAVRMEFSGGGRMKMRFPSKLEVDARIGDVLAIHGLIEWRDDNGTRYFGIGGTLDINGLVEGAECGVTIGTMAKAAGRVVPLVSLFGEADYTMTLFSGAVARRIGVGAGINRRLQGIDDNPNAEELIAAIDSVRLDNWVDVERDGFYLAIVGQLTVTSGAGAPTDIDPYVLSLLLCIDSNLNISAAAKLWFYSSLDFTRQTGNRERPAMVGALVISPRQQLITAAVESRQNAAVEGNDTLARILAKGRLRFSFLLSPALVDFFLQEISYEDDFLGTRMLFRGSMRFAIFQGTVLLRSNYSLTGTFKADGSESCGGVEGDAKLSVRLDSGGLLRAGGMIAYGGLDVSAAARARVWTKIEFSRSWRAFRRTITISWSKTFTLASVRFELGLAGNVGFDTRGAFGFDGRLSVSVPICGYRLRINPSFRFNDGVIAEARSQVAAFEERIEAYRQELLGGGRRRFQLPARTARAPAWLLYRRGDWCLALPRDDTSWVTPVELPDATELTGPFDNPVAAITIKDAAGIPKVRLLAPWHIGHRAAMPQDLREHAAQIEATLYETIGAEAVPSLRDATVVQDPRLRSTSRVWWTEEDQARLPDHALPLRMRDTAAVLEGERLPEGTDSEFAQLADYLYWRRRARRLERHAGSERSEGRTALENRAALIHAWLEDLQLAESNAGDPAASIWRARPIRVDGSLQIGWVFKLDAAQNIDDEIDVETADGTVTTFELVLPQESVDTLVRSVAPAPARQEFMLDSDNPDASDGRVVVKLPIHFESGLRSNLLVTPYFEDGGLEAISHFQVLRRLPGEVTETVIADHLRPDLQPVDAEGQTILVAGGYLLTDEFPVIDRTLDRSLAIRGVEYRLRAVAIGETEVETNARPSRPWPMVRLHVPAADRFPQSLMMVMPFDALIPNSAQWGVFALISTTEDGTSAFAEFPEGDATRPLAPDDFELRVESVSWSETGFYGREDAPAATSTSPPPFLDQLSEPTTAAGRSLFDKDVLTVDVLDGPLMKITNLPPTTKMAHRFFIRPKLRRPDAPDEPATAIGMLQPLVHAVVPDLDSGAPWPGRQRTLPCFEWIPAQIRDDVRAGRFEEVTVEQTCRQPDWSAGDLRLADPTPAQLTRLRELRQEIGLEWQAAGAGTGGVELLIRDIDDSALQNVVLCEITPAEVFRTSRLDFRDPALWVPTPLEQSRRRELDLPAFRTPPRSQIETVFLLDNPQDELIEALNRRSESLRGLLDATGGRDVPAWMDLWAAARNLLTSVFAFNRTPLNIDDEPLRRARAHLTALTRWLLLGRTLPVTTLQSLTDAVIRQIDDTLRAQLIDLETKHPDMGTFPTSTDDEMNAARRAYLDDHRGGQLAAIVRRRLACAAELFDADDNELPGDVDATVATLPGGADFEKIRQDVAVIAAECGAPLERCRALLDIFPAGIAADPRTAPAAALLREAIDEFKKLALPSEIAGDAARAARVIPCLTRAAGLTLSLNALADSLLPSASTLVKRSHHAVTVGRDREGQARGTDVMLTALLPDAGRNIAPANLVVYYANILERLGFAQDIAVLDSRTNPWTQSRLMQHLDDRHIANASAECITFLLVGREPDADYPDPKQDNDVGAVGFSFVKLCVVPLEFHNLLVNGLVRTGTNDAAVQVNADRLGEWLAIRSITAGDAPAETLGTLGAVARYVIPSAYATLLRGPAASPLPVLRLTAQDRRWISVPHRGGRARIAWTLPDTARHRPQVLGRRVSRYEPLIRWVLQLHQPTTWKSPVDQPADLDILCVRRLIATPDQVDRPEELPVAIHPHPTRIQFSVPAPAAAARSRMSNISAIRTGSQGFSIVFQYGLRDHDDAALRGWEPLLAAVDFQASSVRVEDPPAAVDPVAAVAFADIRLFRHERLITLQDLTYFHEFWLTARSQYDADVLESAKPPPPPPPPPGASPPPGPARARRAPSLIAMREPTIEGGVGGDADAFAVTLFLTRTGDLLTPAEWSASPPLRHRTVGVAGGTLNIPDDRLPEPACGYRLIYALDDLSQQDNVNVTLGQLVMPWHAEYRLRQSNPLRPNFQSLDSRIVITEDQQYPVIEGGQSEQAADDDDPYQPAWRVTLRFTRTVQPNDPEPILSHLDRVRMFVTRDGAVSAVRPVREVP